MQGQTLKRADIPLPGGGEAVYQGSGLAYYRHADWLGSSRLASTPGAQEYSIAAYAPYGEPYDDSQGPDHVFAGQKQDIVGGQYDFLLREYNPIQGRWWTPDPAGLAAVDPNNPQSWNRYAYVGGTPLEATDPLGLDPCPPGSSVQWCFSGNSEPGLGQQNTPPGMGSGGLDLLIVALQQELSFFWPGSAQPGVVVPGGGELIAPPNWPPAPLKAPPAPQKENLFLCAASFADRYSIAGGLNTLDGGNSGGAGGFLTNALGGNTFSGLTDAVVHGASAADLAFSGTLLGFGGSTAWQKGLSGVATDALARGAWSFVTGAGQTIQTLAGATSLASTGISAGEFASGVGEAKLIYDGGTYIAGLFACKGW